MKQLCSCSSHKYVREIYGRKKMCEVDDVTLDMFLKKYKKSWKEKKKPKGENVVCQRIRWNCTTKAFHCISRENKEDSFYYSTVGISY